MRHARAGWGAMLLGLAAATRAGPADSALHPDVLRLVDTWLAAQQAYLHLPAVSVAVAAGEAPLWSRGYGAMDRAGRQPASGQTLYGICSVSKLFTAVAVMTQVDAGRLQLDQGIETWLPGLRLPGAQAHNPVTLRGLLTHSAGLAREPALSYWSPPDFPFPDRAGLLAALPPAFMAPGERMQYSNLGMALAGAAAAQAAGQSFEALLQQQVLEPLGLRQTYTRLPVGHAQLAQGWSAPDRQGQRQRVPPYDAKALTPAAGLASSVEDLVRFAQWHWRLLRQGGPEVLSAQSLREILRVQWRDPDGAKMRGLAWRISEEKGERVLMHDGQCPGYLSQLVLLPQPRIAYALAMNANDNRWIDDQLGKPLRDLLQLTPPAAAAAAADAPLADYVGRYDDRPWTSETVVLPWGHELLALALPSQDPAADLQRLRRVAPDRFRALRSDGSLAEEWVFTRGTDGRVNGLKVWDQFTPRAAP